jgi:hypothetical protein
MPTPARLLLALAASAALCRPALARETVAGDGDKVTETRKATGFDRVVLQGPLDVEVTEGPAHAVAVTIDRNLQALVRTAVRGTTLVVETERNLSYRGAGKVAISTPELAALVLQGSGDAVVAGAEKDRDVALSIEGSGNIRWSGKAGHLRVKIAGSGDVDLSGAASSLDGEVAGSGDVRARDLVARGARLAVSGSGDMAVTLDGGDLRATVDGSGDIAWYGKASATSSAVSGSGSIVHR